MDRLYASINISLHFASVASTKLYYLPSLAKKLVEFLRNMYASTHIYPVTSFTSINWGHFVRGGVRVVRVLSQTCLVCLFNMFVCLFSCCSRSLRIGRELNPGHLHNRGYSQQVLPLNHRCAWVKDKLQDFKKLHGHRLCREAT